MGVFRFWLVYDRKTAARPFDTIHDILRSLSLAQALLKRRNSPIWRIGNRGVNYPFRLFIPPGVQQGPEYFGQPWAAYYPVEEPATPYMSFDSRMKVLVDQVEYYFSDANLAKGRHSLYLSGD